MTNQEKGEAVVRLSGKDYRLKLGTNALIVLQESLCTNGHPPPSIAEIFQGVSSGRVLYLRAFLWAAMQKHHPTMTLEGVSELLDDADIPEVSSLLASLGISTVPDPADLKDLGVPENPQTARATARARKTKRGTGGRSSSKRVASD